jgi:Bacterial toxin 50
MFYSMIHSPNLFDAVFAREYKSLEGKIFEYWLRTGIVVTFEPEPEGGERKFNPYHDEIGRFTSPPGAIVSYGNSRAAASLPASQTDRNHRRSRAGSGSRTPILSTAASANSPSGFRSEFVRNAVSPTTSNADSYFELRKRQAYLDHLRREAGPNPAPAVREDLDDFQRRLDTNRNLLDQRAKIADRETLEFLRAGLSPVNVAAGARNIATGEGELRDYLAVAGAVPIAGAVSKLSKLTPKRLPAVHMGKQGKHIIGHNNFRSGQSVLTADPHVLAQKAGTGVPVNSVPRGQAGFKERVDFGEVIGFHTSRAKTTPTTKGMIHYDKNGQIHIVPARP